MPVKKIKFKGEEFLLITSIFESKKGGAIATQEEYENFELNYAHLCEDGIVRRYSQEIGTIKDIEFLGDQSCPEED